MKIKNKELKRRIIDISYRNKLSHIGSCLSAVDIIQEIFEVKKTEEKFVLSSGHAGLALYVVLERYEGRDAEKIFAHHGVHPDRCGDCGLDCSTGSLGQGLPIALGMACADRSRNVYCLISDGESREGSIWEAFQIASEQKLTNLKIYLNINNWGAYRTIDGKLLEKQLSKFPKVNINIRETSVEQLPFLKGQSAHYYVMNDEDYKNSGKILK